MREILFRGKRTDNEEWCIGFYYYYQVADESDGGARVKHMIVVPTLKNQIGFLVYEVDPTTVGQYTGLTDKNGKKIFEGDIVIDPDYPDTIYQVDYVDGAFVAKERTTNEQFFLRDFVVFGEPEVEVIGNIHDNPELLEDKACD